MISAERNLVTVVIPNAPPLAARTDGDAPPCSSVAGATSGVLFIRLVGVFSTPLPMSSKAWNPGVSTASSEVRAAFAVSWLWLIAPQSIRFALRMRLDRVVRLDREVLGVANHLHDVDRVCARRELI